LIFGLLRRCVAFQRHHGDPWSILDVTIWSLTSPLVKRTSGSKKFRSSPQKDFCNNIGHKRNSTQSATFSLVIVFDGNSMSKDARTVFETYKPTTLTFDCYGTLIDWESGACRALRDIYGYSKSRITDADLIGLFLQSDARIIRENIFPYSNVLQRVAQSVATSLGVMSDTGLEVLFARSLPSWPPFQETNACLTWLARRYRLAVISNIDDRLLSQTIKQFAVQFDVLVTSEQTKSYKPTPLFLTEPSS
jgi:2-haloalkanoic acid dehalogenase type II